MSAPIGEPRQRRSYGFRRTTFACFALPLWRTFLIGEAGCGRTPGGWIDPVAAGTETAWPATPIPADDRAAPPAAPAAAEARADTSTDKGPNAKAGAGTARRTSARLDV
jgi:hypothetical protein